MRFLLFTPVLLLFAAACTTDRVTVNTPTTPPESINIAGDDTPAPTSANTVDPVARHVAESDTSSRPRWLKARIAETLSHRKQYPIIRIMRYEYEGQTVYWESAPCCDQMSMLYNTRGRLICNPDGGITGKGDGKCPDFDKKKANEQVVWQDPR